VLERDVEKGALRFREDVVALRVAELAVDVDPPAPAPSEPGGDLELAVDRHRLAIPDEDPRRDRREAVPGGE
jgi:hypothetical protein